MRQPTAALAVAIICVLIAGCGTSNADVADDDPIDDSAFLSSSVSWR